MLQPKELDKLFQILNTKEHSLEDIQDLFLNAYCEELSVFQASYTLSHLINHNLLTLQQRIITLFLLIQNYKTEGINKNPFGATILNISQKTLEGFQRKMISDLILEGLRQKYTTRKLEQLFVDEQLMIELTPERTQIKKLRQEFMAQRPKISKSRTSQILNIIPDTYQRRKTLQPPEQFIRNPLKEKRCLSSDFNVGVMRPIPKFIQINASQMTWLSPGVIIDIHWDNSHDVEKKFAKFKGYIKKGLQSKLSKEQSSEIDRCLQNQAYAVLNLDLTPQNLILLIKNNPAVAASFLTKLGNYPVAGQYLEGLIDCDISLNCIDVMLRLLKSSRIPIPLIETFALKYLKQSQYLEQNFKDKLKMGRVICNFVIFLIKNNIGNITQFSQTIKEFTNHFKEIEESQSLEKHINNLKK